MKIAPILFFGFLFGVLSLKSYAFDPVRPVDKNAAEKGALDLTVTSNSSAPLFVIGKGDPDIFKKIWQVWDSKDYELLPMNETNTSTPASQDGEILGIFTLAVCLKNKSN